MFLVIQHLILDGRTTDAINKIRELFPSLLNDRNLLLVLKVRQFIEMINGTESEISNTSVSCPPIISLENSTATKCSSPNNLSAYTESRSNSPSCPSPSTNKNCSYPTTTTRRSSSPITKTHASLRSRSNSPYTSGRTQIVNTTTTTILGTQEPQHSNGTINSSSHRSNANSPNESLQGRSIELILTK